MADLLVGIALVLVIEGILLLAFPKRLFNILTIISKFSENKIRLINFWASWCPPCRVEHPQLEKLSKKKNIQLFGVNYKDSENSALNFLNEYGNPFLKIGSDKNGRNAIEWGVYGVPETFAIDKYGNVLFRHAGPITKAVLEKKFNSLIK